MRSVAAERPWPVTGQRLVCPCQWAGRACVPASVCVAAGVQTGAAAVARWCGCPRFVSSAAPTVARTQTAW